MEATQTLLINQGQIKQLIDMHDVNQAVHETFVGFGRRDVKNPTKVTLDLGQNDDWPAYDGFANAMPAYIGGEDDVAGLKWVLGIAGERKAAGLPYINGMILLADPAMGEFKAIMDGAFITNLRTGAQAANTLAYFAGKREEISFGLYGTGTQARTTVMAIADLYQIKHIDLWNHRDKSAESFIRDMQKYVKGDIKFVGVDKPEDAAKNEFVITATSSADPILQADWFKPGQKIIPLGSGQEVSNQLILKADDIVVDHPGQAFHRGSLANLYAAGRIDRGDITTTIGAIASGRYRLQKEDVESSLVLAIPIGTGAMDIAVAEKVYQKAKADSKTPKFAFQDQNSIDE